MTFWLGFAIGLPVGAAALLCWLWIEMKSDEAEAQLRRMDVDD